MRDEHVAQLVTEAWRSVLELVTDGDGADFFELGGDSLTALALIDRIRDDLRVDVPLELIFFDGRLEALIDACVGLTAARRSSIAHIE